MQNLIVMFVTVVCFLFLLRFTIIAEIVSLLKKIYKRDAPFRAVFKVKTLAVLFPPYAREMKTNTAKFNSAANPTRALLHARGLSMRTHLTAVGSLLAGRC